MALLEGRRKRGNYEEEEKRSWSDGGCETFKDIVHWIERGTKNVERLLKMKMMTKETENEINFTPTELIIFLSFVPRG